jgi:hypothetical protein
MSSNEEIPSKRDSKSTPKKGFLRRDKDFPHSSSPSARGNEGVLVSHYALHGDF